MINLPSRWRARTVLGSALLISLATASRGLAQTPPASSSAAAGNDELVQLSVFNVSSERDSGYRASNSIAGTRTNTPIKDIPINIQVFTKDLADDLLIKNQVDFESYNAALVNGGADRYSDNVIQQSYQNFLFRGFRQNWGLRDGIREYDPVDTQNLARVEVVKGPAAALYGLAYPGGVMNNITKTVDFSRNFAQVRLTAGAEGDYRSTVDGNVSGNILGGKFGVRYNGVYEKTKDAREHSDGAITLNAINLAWQPTQTTQLEFLAEEGYREISNGLGYFSLGNEAGAPGNHSDIPLQIAHPEIPWTWNWANNRNKTSLDVKLYRGVLTQKVGDAFQIQAQFQYSKRLNIAGSGWDANGSGGGDAYESASSGYNAETNMITSTYHYRDWGNQMHAYGATGVYKLDFEPIKNTFAFGANVWAEKELSRASRPLDPLASAVIFPAVAGIEIPNQVYVPSDVVPETDGGPNGNGYHHENNSNDYYFINWQAAMLNNRLKTNIGVNKTNMKLIGWNNGASVAPENVYEASKVSPLYGVVYDITPAISVFAVHATSLFPDTTKDSFGNQFSPQVGSSIEGGVKVDLFNGKISGSASYYRIKQKGGTQSAPNHENLNTQTWDNLSPEERAVRFPGRTREDLFAAGDIIQGGEQEAKGFDIDLVFQPLPELQVLTSFTHVDHEFTESAVPSTIGQTYPQAIKNRYSLLAKYTFLHGPAKNLAFGLGVAGGTKALMDYQTWNGETVARYEPGRTVVETFASYRFKMFARTAVVQFNIKNLTKEPDYVGWKATGSSSVLATERYEVPTPVVYRLTLGIDL
jgi:outer membrane receptor protein involved in Fe transport